MVKGMDAECLGDRQKEEELHGRIAQVVAALFLHTIAESVLRAIAAGREQLKRELGDQTHRFTKTEQQISDLEDELHQAQLTLQ